MIVNVILDSRFPEKQVNVNNELLRQGISECKIWDCVVLPDVISAINASHKMVVRWAKENKQKEVIIFEDDICFPNENGWQFFLDNKPTNFDVYIGGTYLISNEHNWIPRIVKVNEWVGSHCVIIAEKYYDTFLSLPDNQHIDTINKGKGDFYVCFPFAAIQREGYSSNNKTVVNYNTTVPKGYIYE